MNILGVVFDSKMNWNTQVSRTILKANKNLQAIKIISKYFTPKTLVKISTSLFYQRLYYGSNVWLSESLSANCKQKLLSASSNCLRVCSKSFNRDISFIELHKKHQRATPMQWNKYVTACTLHDIYNLQTPSNIFISTINNILNENRNDLVHFTSTNNLKIGKSTIDNRFRILNNKIKFEMLEWSKDRFKSYCKRFFISECQ